MSGAGRSTAANVLEDLGWLVVDNLPPQLLSALADLRDEARERNPEAAMQQVAVVVDVRSRGWFGMLSDAIAAARDRGEHPSLVFLDATDEALVRRFESVRRPHPLQAAGRLLDGIQLERETLVDLRSSADVVIDTSGLNVHQLTAKLSSLFAGDRRAQLRIAVMSFGFKYGLPLDSDVVFDLRFLPNPFWVPELRPLTGRDEPVAEFVMAQPGAEEFVEPRLRPARDDDRGLRAGGTSLRHGGVGMHGRQAPLGRHRRGAEHPAGPDRPGRHLRRAP